MTASHVEVIINVNYSVYACIIVCAIANIMRDVRNIRISIFKIRKRIKEGYIRPAVDKRITYTEVKMIAV